MKKSFSVVLNYSEAYFHAIIYTEYQYVPPPINSSVRLLMKIPESGIGYLPMNHWLGKLHNGEVKSR